MYRLWAPNGFTSQGAVRHGRHYGISHDNERDYAVGDGRSASNHANGQLGHVDVHQGHPLSPTADPGRAGLGHAGFAKLRYFAGRALPGHPRFRALVLTAYVLDPWRYRFVSRDFILRSARIAIRQGARHGEHRYR